MAIDFPNSPSVNATYTVGNRTWIYDGTSWNTYNTTSFSAETLPGTNLKSTVTGSSLTTVGTLNGLTVINGLTATGGSTLTGGTVIATATAGQDSVTITGRAGGTSSYSATLTPTTLTANRTLTLPDATGTVALTSDPGLILVKTHAVGSGVTEAEVTSAFSSTYRNYLVTWTGGTMTSSSADSQIAFQLGASNTQYYNSLVYNTNSSTPLAAYGSNQTTGNWIGGGSTTDAMAQVTLYGPNVAIHTRYTSDTYLVWADGGFGKSSGIHQVSTAYTSIKLIVTGTGTMTGGTIRVYGYRNS